MASLFRKAEKIKAPLRIGLTGPSGSGKTMSALRIAKGIGAPVVVLDTERGSAAKYSHVAEFYVHELDDFDPREFIRGIDAAEREFQGGTLIIDSLSAAWAGRGGALESVDIASKKTGNSYTAWKDVTPKINALVDRILTVKMHVIVCYRSKVEYKLEPNEKGKLVPRNMGIVPIFRDGVHYEYDVFGMMTPEHELLVQKTRCPSIVDKVFFEPGEDLARILLQWAEHGIPAPPNWPLSTDPSTAAFGLEQELLAATQLAEVEGIVQRIRATDLTEEDKAVLGLAYRQAVARLESPVEASA